MKPRILQRLFLKLQIMNGGLLKLWRINTNQFALRVLYSRPISSSWNGTFLLSHLVTKIENQRILKFDIVARHSKW